MIEDIQKPDARALMFGAFAKAVKPRKRLLVSEWADANYVLTSKSSPLPGKWRTSVMPHIKEPMDCLSAHSPVKKVVCKFPVQMAKTEMLLIWNGYIEDHAPGPSLFIQPTLELRDRYVVQRVNPMHENTECLAKLFDTKVQRSASNSKDIKDYAGGISVYGGANSPRSLSSMPIKNIGVDELDRCPRTFRDEGSFIVVLDGRQTNFQRNGKTCYISSPTMKDASEIDEQFDGGDRRYRHVPCPYCAEMIVLKFSQLHYTLIKGKVTEVWYVCEKCGSEIEEHHKPFMLSGAVWIPEDPTAPYRSYTIETLYSPLGIGWSWMKMATEWVACVGNDAKEKSFTNMRRALSWEGKHKNLKPRVIMQRAEDYAARSVPPGVLVITAGIDTQDDRLAIQLTGFGRGGRMWVLDYFELDGDPNGMVEDFIHGRGALFDYLSHPLKNAWGVNMHIQAVGWDTQGHRTDAIYTMCRSKKVSRLLGLKGSSIAGKQIMAGRPSYQDVKWNGKANKRGAALWMVGTDTAKDLILSLLDGDEDKPAEERMIRFSKDLDEEFFKMLLAEKFDPEKNRYVKKSNARNESIDTFVYSLAAARHNALRVHMKTVADWDALERIYQPESVKTVSVTDVEAGEEPGEIEEVKQVSSSGGVDMSKWKRG